jgi:hypothetical protein
MIQAFARPSHEEDREARRIARPHAVHPFLDRRTDAR